MAFYDMMHAKGNKISKKKIIKILLTFVTVFSITIEKMHCLLIFQLMWNPVCQQKITLDLYISVWQSTYPKKYGECVMAALVTGRRVLELLMWNIHKTTSCYLYSCLEIEFFFLNINVFRYNFNTLYKLWWWRIKFV